MFPLCLCVVDMKGGRQLCGKLDSAICKQPSLSCTCLLVDLDKSTHICDPMKISHDECKQFSIDGYHLYKSAVFQKRSQSDIFEYPDMSDLNETIFVLERESIRVTNAIDMLDNSKSL